jgi:hypothetical protein
VLRVKPGLLYSTQLGDSMIEYKLTAAAKSAAMGDAAAQAAHLILAVLRLAADAEWVWTVSGKENQDYLTAAVKEGKRIWPA